MSLVNTVNAALQTAIRNKDTTTRTVLRTLVGEAQTRAKRDQVAVSDALLSKLIKDFVKNNKDSLALRDNPALEQENAILMRFLPQQMSDHDIRAAVAASGGTDIGSVMRYLSANHAGLYDGKQANVIARSMLS